MPLRMGAYVEHIPFKEVIELAWDETVVRVGIEVTALPVVHFQPEVYSIEMKPSGPGLH